MFYNEEQTELLERLGTTIEGLSSVEVQKRLTENGRNILPKKKNISVFQIFLKEWQDPIVLLLVFAAFVSFLIGEGIDSLAIFLILLLDVIMGTYQEHKANRIADSLGNLIRVQTKVKRDGKVFEVASEELTVGDIVFLESGSKISADLRILESQNLTIDESVLTGESLPVHKTGIKLLQESVQLTEQKNMAFAGTSVVTGRAMAVVCRVGLETEVGKIADRLNTTKEEKSPLTIRVEKFSKQISLLVLIISLLIMVLLMLQEVPYSTIFLSVVALFVSAMPEGLPLALTMALTIASNKMAKKNVIVRKLNSVESLGSCTVIASDKTGTLTVNEQTAKKILLPNSQTYEVTGVGYEATGKVLGEHLEYAKEIAFCGVINNEAVIDENRRIGDSIDIAFLVLGKKLGISSKEIKILGRIPYESENQYSAVFFEKNQEVYCTVKGSLEKVRTFCKDIYLTEETLSSSFLEEQNTSLAQEGYRVIALATGKVGKREEYSSKDIQNLTFLGMVGFIDPVRKEVVSSLQECKSAGIRVLMITGDHPLTAFSIAKELGLTNSVEEVTTGEEVEKYFQLGEEDFDSFVSKKRVFSRVNPIQKLEIVESLKRRGEFVAVTGDGVNDAPALKASNIGVAMGSGTDIARDASDMIILDDRFTSIVAGIKEGRIAYANIRKIIYFLISCGFAEVLCFCLAILFDLPMPLIAIQLLWLNVVTDGIQDLALSFEQQEKGIMQEAPRSPKETLFSGGLLQEILISGSIIGLLVFLVWHFLIRVVGMDTTSARGYIMALMVFMQNIHVFNCRSEKQSAFTVSLKSNLLIVGGVLFSILLQVIVMEVPIFSKFLATVSIPFIHLIYLFLIALLILLFMEVYKKIRYGGKS